MQQPLAYARRLMTEHGLDEWGLRLSRATRTAGTCSHLQKVISLSGPLFALWTEDECRLTILHEIAHALTPGHGHDRVWQLKCIEIGGDGKRCYSGEKNPIALAKYIGSCPGGHKHTKARKPTRVSTCAKCAPKYDPRYTITWRENPYRG